MKSPAGHAEKTCLPCTANPIANFATAGPTSVLSNALGFRGFGVYSRVSGLGFGV